MTGGFVSTAFASANTLSPGLSRLLWITNALSRQSLESTKIGPVPGTEQSAATGTEGPALRFGPADPSIIFPFDPETLIMGINRMIFRFHAYNMGGTNYGNPENPNRSAG